MQRKANSGSRRRQPDASRDTEHRAALAREIVRLTRTIACLLHDAEYRKAHDMMWPLVRRIRQMFAA